LKTNETDITEKDEQIRLNSADLQHMRIRLQTGDNRINELKLTLDDKIRIENELHSNVTRHSEELTRTKNDLAAKILEVQQLKLSTESQNNAIEKSTQEKQILSTQIVSLKDGIQQRDNNIEKLNQNADQDKNNYETQLKQKLTQLEELQQTIKDKDGETEQQIIKSKNLAADKVVLQQKIETIESSLKNTEEALRDKSSLEIKLRHEILSLENTTLNQKKNLENTEREIRVLKQQMNIKDGELSQITKEKEKLETNLNTKLNETETTLAQNEKENQDLKKSNETLKISLEAMMKNLEDAVRTKNEMEEELKSKKKR